MKNPTRIAKLHLIPDPPAEFELKHAFMGESLAELDKAKCLLCGAPAEGNWNTKCPRKLDPGMGV